MSTYLPYEANRVRLDDARRQAAARRSSSRTPTATAIPAVAIRRAHAADVDTLRRLAALDGARPWPATSSSPRLAASRRPR